MAKLAIFFLVAVAFQASFAVPRFYEDNTLFKYLDEIRTEVKDITLYLEKDFPEDHLALKTITWQCHKLVEVVEVIINKLREETFTYQPERLSVFKQVIYILEELRDSLKQVTLYHEITNIYELKKNFIVCINLVLERFEKLAHLTYNLYPEFQYSLKYLFVDFMTTLHGIRSHFVHINQGFKIVQTPRVLIKEIHEYTREFTDILKEFVHPTQVKVALREYLMYINEIVHKLQEENILGHKELDVVLHHLTNKLREIVFPVMQTMTETTIDMKVFRTKIITDLYEVVSVFEQLVQLCEDKVLPAEVSSFLIKVIYHYWYAIRHVIHETKFGYKIGFYTPKYYNTEYYGKHGYGLYEKFFYNRFYTPYKFDIPFEYKNIKLNSYTPYKYEALFPIHKFEVEPFYGKSLEWNKYFSGMKYEYESPKDLVLTIQMLVKRIFERFERNTWEVTDVKTVLFHNIREFITVLDYILEKFETKVTFERTLYVEKYLEECIYKIKEIKRELKEFLIDTELVNLPEIKTRFLRCVEIVATEWCKLIEKCDVERSFWIKEICMKFVSFLNKVCYERVYTPEYYKEHTMVPYKYNSRSHVLPFHKEGWLNYNEERFVPTVYNRLY